MTDFTKAELEQAVQKGSEQAVKNVLASLGVDATKPFELQQDFAYLRRQRESSEQVGVWIKRGVITTALTGGFTLLWLGINQAFK